MSGADSPVQAHLARPAERVPASSLEVHTSGTYSQTDMRLDLTFLRGNDRWNVSRTFGDS